jgi:hypothetical protein
MNSYDLGGLLLLSYLSEIWIYCTCCDHDCHDDYGGEICAAPYDRLVRQTCYRPCCVGGANETLNVTDAPSASSDSP